ncbi:MAG: hypothetical protein O3B13_02100 [Planctomycetota bacterium]|nr:hypothetical protein [Planctomycetota bacterium]
MLCSSAGPLVVSVAALVAIGIRLDPADCRPNLPQGPGITLDESFNVQMGVYLVECFKSYGLAILHPKSAKEVFGDPNYNPDHPPLGRLWLGLFHEMVQAVAPVENVDGPFVTASARLGSACAFALTVLLVGVFSSNRWGAFAGVTSSISLVAMPRLFGHAHLASLETITGFVWTVAILGTIQLWTTARTVDQNLNAETSSTGAEIDPPDDRTATISGLLIGLALLTKMQAILLPPLIIVWGFWHWRSRAVRPLLITLCSLATVFIAGWPWLWLDLPGHLVEYFGRTTDRVSLNAWYLGQSFADVDVPWHYPWVMALVTIPAGVLLLAAAGVKSAGWNIVRDPAMSLVVGSTIAPLVLFSLPGVAVYDGARLFLVAFPGVAVLAGFGVVSVQAWLTRRKPSLAPLLALFVVGQLTGIATTAPYCLSCYNLAVGGLNGANRLGFEVTYWGDSFSREFLQSLVSTTPTGVVQVAPVLHQFQLVELQRQAPMLRHRAAADGPGLSLVPFRANLESREVVANKLADSNESWEYLAVFHRRADAPSTASLTQSGWKFVSSISCQGVDISSTWQRRVVSAAR